MEIGFCVPLPYSSIILTCFKNKITIRLCRGAEFSEVAPLVDRLELLCKAIRTAPDKAGFTLSKSGFRSDAHKPGKGDISEIRSKDLGMRDAKWDAEAIGYPTSPTVLFKRDLFSGFLEAPAKTGSETMNPRAQEKRIIKPGKFIVEITADLCYEPLPKLEHDCWQLLLDSCIVVDRGPERKPRPSFGKGIQLSFDLMATLAGVEFSMVIDKGVLFVGYQSVLIPVKVEGNFSQFHLMTTQNGQIDPYKCVSEIQERYICTDPTYLKRTTCFLGWCNVAQINLGTKALISQVGYSNGRARETSLELNGFKLSVIGSAPTNATGVKIQTNYTFRTHRVHFEPSSIYKKLLVDTSHQLALIYDSTEKRSWIVPKLSLLLHMVHAYILTIPGISDDQVPFVEPYTDPNQIVDKVFGMGGENYGDADQPFLFRNLMVGFNLNLIATTRNIQKSSGNTLNGYELWDIVGEHDRGACMQYVKVLRKRSNWIDLANLVDSVIVCSRFGDAITPSKSTGDRRNSLCDSIPQGFDYLATTGQCLKQLLKQEYRSIGDGTTTFSFSDGLLWRIKGNLVQKCCHKDGSTATCWERPDIFQELSKVRWYQQLSRRNMLLPADESTLSTSAGIVFK
jgi:hypothetical protein